MPSNLALRGSGVNRAWWRTMRGMRDVILLRVPFEDWYCPNCSARDTQPSLPPNASRFHACGGLHGLNAPLVRVGSDVKVTAEEREDYLNGEVQATGDDGRAYMAVRTTYADGHDDLTVNAGLAQARMGDG
jgi:hypothetical protein